MPDVIAANNKRLRDMGDGSHAEVVALAPALLQEVPVTIADGVSLSGAADLTGRGTPVAVITDADWDTNAMTFQGSVDGVLYSDLRVAGVEVSIAGVVASSLEPLDPMRFLACRYLKVRSGPGAAPVPQVGDTVVTIVCRPVSP
jgi:hypothetical protein